MGRWIRKGAKGIVLIDDTAPDKDTDRMAWVSHINGLTAMAEEMAFSMMMILYLGDSLTEKRI